MPHHTTPPARAIARPLTMLLLIAIALGGAPGQARAGGPSACKLPFSGGTGTGVGFPVSSVRLRSKGVVRATVLFVDFPDAPATREPQQLQRLLSPGAERMVAHMSGGRMKLELRPHLRWLRLRKRSSVYAAGLSAAAPHRAFIAEAVKLADPAVDLSKTDLVVVISTPNARALRNGPTWLGVAHTAIVADGRRITNGMTSGRDLLHWGHGWLNHELGHSMGLPDLYAYGSSPQGGFTRPFSLMDLISAEAPELLAWERWQLGWLAPAQVACNPPARPILLRPLGSTRGATEAAMVRVSPTRVLVVESRRARGYDARLAREGVVVSLIDTRHATGRGPIRVLNPKRLALRAGQHLSAEGVRVEVIASGDDGDLVLIKR